MKKFVLTAFAVFSGTILFALSAPDYNNMETMRNAPEGMQELTDALALSVDTALEAKENETGGNSVNLLNAVVEIKAVFDSATTTTEFHKSLASGRIFVHSTETKHKTKALTQKCSGAFVNGGVVILPTACIEKEEVCKEGWEDWPTNEVYTYGAKECTKYSLNNEKAILITFNDKSSISLTKEVAESRTYAPHTLWDYKQKNDLNYMEYRFIITSQKNKFNNLPKFGLFADDYDLRQFLSGKAKNNLVIATWEKVSFSATDKGAKCDNCDDCDGIGTKNSLLRQIPIPGGWGKGYEGPIFFENTLVGVTIDSNIYALRRDMMPEKVLAAIGSKNITVFSKPKTNKTATAQK